MVAMVAALYLPSGTALVTKVFRGGSPFGFPQTKLLWEMGKTFGSAEKKSATHLIQYTTPHFYYRYI